MDTLQRMTALATTAVLLGACAGGPFAGDAPIPTMPEAPPPPVPTLTEATAADPPPPAGTQAQPAPDTPPTGEDAQPAGDGASAAPAEALPGPTTDDPVALGQALGVQGLAELLAADPPQAGNRGEDLLQSLRQIADGPDRRRIQRLQDRVADWVEEGELDPEIAQAVQAALAQQLEDLPGRGNGDDDDDDDDD